MAHFTWILLRPPELTHPMMPPNESTNAYVLSQSDTINPVDLTPNQLVLMLQGV